MLGQNVSRYSSAKFVVLTDPENITSAKRNYFTWLISVTVLFGITAGLLCLKVFLPSAYFNETLPQLPDEGNNDLVSHSSKSSVPDLFHSAFRKRVSEERSEFLCEQPRMKLEAVSLAVRKRILQNHHSENIYDSINRDLLMFYESAMNEYNPKHLKSVFNRYQLKLSAVRQSAEFIDFLKGLAFNKFKFYGEYLKKHKFQLKFTNFDWIFALTEELNQWYNYLDRLRGLLSDYEQQIQRKNWMNVTKSNFTTFIEETHTKLFHFVYPFSVTEKKLSEVNEIISEWTKPAQVYYSNCSLMLVNRAILLSEAKEQVHALNASCVKNVYVYASQILYLDTDLELSGVNVAIVSPNWKFLKKVKINLDGASGHAHASGSASTGQAGKPGNPGGNAGDFLGVGSFQEKLLLVSANGGIGGAGQNGARGRDGVNNTRPYLPFDKPACINQVKTFRNLFSLKMTHYEIYGEEGCGGPGTDGGVGGLGGQGGVITLMTKNSVKITKGFTGAMGRPGKGGPGGTGGRNGCFFEAVDENDEFLHPVTTIKCPVGNTLPSGQSGKDNDNSRGQVYPPRKENLTVYNCIFNYIRLTKEHLVKYGDRRVILFLKELNLYKDAGIEDVLKVFTLIEEFGRFEYYEFFKDILSERFLDAENTEAGLIFSYLKSLVLGEMIYLKKNINYFFVDMKNYLDVVVRSIRSTRESTRELEAVSYFEKKIGIKIDEIEQSLKLLKINLKVPFESGRNYSSEALQEKRVSCVMIITVDLITCLMYPSSEMNLLELKDSLSMCSMAVTPISKSQPRTQIFEKNDLANVEEVLRGALETLFFEEEPSMMEHLVELRGALDILKESNSVREGEKQFLQILVDELEHFAALYYFVEWKGLEDLFSKSLNNLTTDGSLNSSRSTEMEFLKVRLMDVMIAVQYKLAEDASRQNFYPSYRTDALQLPWKRTMSEVLTQLNILRELGDQSPFCKNHVKAVFERNSTVGEFFSWPNAQIKNELKALFSGAEINLKSNLINRHVLDKSLIQFASLKIDFDCPGRESSCKKLREILMNFKIDITHSGYSYYNWEGKTHVVVSEKVTLSYNFKRRDNQEPELYNAFFKKCQDGEIKLSPFTTWTVKLFSLNENADFSELAPFADMVNLHLIGTGTYTF